jgi:hypothetical protein
MKIIHVLTVFEDQFSGAKSQVICTRSEDTFEKMKAGIGTVFNRFDKKAQINETLKVIEVRQAKSEDYKNK